MISALEECAVLVAPEEPEGETLSVPVLKVFDGDGFLTRIFVPNRGDVEFGVRLGFIDAPELGQFGGNEARDFLCAQIDRQWVHLAVLTKMDTGGSLDRHKRLVAVPYLREAGPWGHRWRNVELEMVLNGWAWLIEKYEPPNHYFHALEDARRHRRGIWSFEENIPPWEFKRQTRRRRGEKNCCPSLQANLFARDEREQPCPQVGCGGHLVERSGRFGTFYGCSEFPKCRYTRSGQASGI
jgi:endonuclease YncB( thermonuclease family)